MTRRRPRTPRRRPHRPRNSRPCPARGTPAPRSAGRLRDRTGRPFTRRRAPSARRCVSGGRLRPVRMARAHRGTARNHVAVSDSQAPWQGSGRPGAWLLITASTAAAVGLVGGGLADVGSLAVQLWAVLLAVGVEALRRR